MTMYNSWQAWLLHVCIHLPMLLTFIEALTWPRKKKMNTSQALE
jgi:hypothetical protein